MTTPTNKEIQKAASAERADLSNVEPGTSVPTGDEAAPPSRIDPTEARKAIFAKGLAHRSSSIASDREGSADVQAIEAGIADAAELGGSGNELIRNNGLDTELPGRGQRPRAPAAPAAASAPGGIAIPPEAIDTATGRVNVRVNGRVLQVPAEDVTRAGGIDAYQKNRAATLLLAENTRKQRELDEREQRLARFEEESRARHGAPQGPATPSPGPAAPGTVPSATDEQGDAARVQAEAEAIITDLYSGDKKRGITAIAQLIQNSRVPAARLDPAEVARQAADLLAARAPAPTASQPDGRQPAPVDPVFDAERKQLNSVMETEFSDLMADPKLKSAALAKFRELWSDPTNRSRSMADVGRDAGAHIRVTMEPNPRQDRIEAKRSQVPPPVATRPAPVAPTAPGPTTPSSYVDRLRKAAGLPPNR